QRRARPRRPHAHRAARAPALAGPRRPQRRQRPGGRLRRRLLEPGAHAARGDATRVPGEAPVVRDEGGGPGGGGAPGGLPRGRGADARGASRAPDLTWPGDVDALRAVRWHLAFTVV